MASTPQILFSPTVTSAVDWATTSWPHAAIATGALTVVSLAGLVLVRTLRRRMKAQAARRRAAASAAQGSGQSPDEGLDFYTVYVTAMAMLLSVNGMWHVFTETMHLPWIVRLVACTVLESAGLAFMRLARTDIQAKRPATRHVAIVWAIALLSGCLSAGASRSVLECVIRIVLPLLAVQLCHSWMLPLPTEVTLTQHELGNRAWRYVKATRRLQRAANPATRWAALKLLNTESDRLTKRSLMTGDATSVLRAAEQMATAEAFAGLGIHPDPGPRDHGPGSATTLTDSDPRTPGPVYGSAHPRTPGPDTRTGDDGPALDNPADPDPGATSAVMAAAALAPLRPNALAPGDASTPDPDPVPPPHAPWALRTLGPITDGPTDGPTDPWPVDPARTTTADPATTGPRRGPADNAPADPRTLTHALNGRTHAPVTVVERLSDPADPAWSEETATIAKAIITGWRADGTPITRNAFLAQLRQNGGAVASQHKSALYAYAIAPDLPEDQA